MAGSGRANADSVLLAALVGGATVADAARRAGVAERTAWRRLDDLAFRLRLGAARERTLGAALGVLERANTRAARTLAALMSVRQPARIRLAAARAVLELTAWLREQGELEERLAALEAAQAMPDDRGRRWGG